MIVTRVTFIHKSHPFNHFKLYGSRAFRIIPSFRIIPLLRHHDNCLFPERFHPPQKKPHSIRLSAPHFSPFPALISCPSLWLCLFWTFPIMLGSLDMWSFVSGFLPLWFLSPLASYGGQSGLRTAADAHGWKSSISLLRHLWRSTWVALTCWLF